MGINQNKLCYMCGMNLEKDEIHKEHLPAKMLSSYLINKPTNLTTIYSCKEHNNNKSMNDFKFYYAILLTQGIEVIDVKKLCGVMDKNGMKKFHRNSGNKELPLPDDQEDYILTLAGGLIYHKFKIPFQRYKHNKINTYTNLVSESKISRRQWKTKGYCPIFNDDNNIDTFVFNITEYAGTTKVSFIFFNQVFFGVELADS